MRMTSASRKGAKRKKGQIESAYIIQQVGESRKESSLNLFEVHPSSFNVTTFPRYSHRLPAVQLP